MNDSLFRKIILGLLVLGMISIIVLLVITIVMYKQVSMITFIEKEIW